MGRCFSRLDNGVRRSRIGAQYLTTKKQPVDEQNDSAAGAVAIGFHGLLLPSGNLYHSIDAVFKLYWCNVPAASLESAPTSMTRRVNQKSPIQNRKWSEPAVGFEPTTC